MEAAPTSPQGLSRETAGGLVVWLGRSESPRLGRVPQWFEGGLSEYAVVHDRHDLTDEQWELLEPHLPQSTAGKAGRPWSDHREVVNAVMWRVRSGAAWRDVPHDYGPWKTVYNRHRRWSGDGTWDRLLRELQRGSDADAVSWDVGIDSTVIRAHQHAAGARHTPPSDVSAERLAVALEDFESTRGRPRPRHTGG
jgi:transposase